MSGLYDSTAYCSRCGTYYGIHNAGCPLEGVKPECMMQPEELEAKRQSERGF